MSVTSVEAAKPKNKSVSKASSMISDDEDNDEQKVDSVDLLGMTKKEPKSAEEDSETANTADLEFDMLPSDVRLYDEKPISSPLEEYLVFVD